VSCLLLYDGLHFIDILPEGLVTGIDFGEIVCKGMNTDAVTCGVFFFDHVLAGREGTCHEKGDLDAVAVQSIQQLFCVDSGTVIEGQIDGFALRIRIIDVNFGKILSRRLPVSCVIGNIPVNDGQIPCAVSNLVADPVLQDGPFDLIRQISVPVI